MSCMCLSYLQEYETETNVEQIVPNCINAMQSMYYLHRVNLFLNPQCNKYSIGRSFS